MTAENTSQPVDLNEETRSIWNQNASFWDDRMGDGNDFQRILIGPASERLLNLQPGETCRRCILVKFPLLPASSDWGMPSCRLANVLNGRDDS